MKTQAIVVATILLLQWASAHAQGDPKAGKVVYERDCGDCHYEDDFGGKTAGDIVKLIEGLPSGDNEHKFDVTKLSEAEKQALAAFFASFE